MTMIAHPTTDSAPLNLLLVGDSDSQLLACEAVAQFPKEANVKITVNAIPRKGTPNGVLERVRALGNLWQLELTELLSQPSLLSFDAIGVFLVGSKLADVRQAIQMLPGSQKPLLFCGFNGIVLNGFEEAISWRLGYDLICLNGPRDAAAMKRLLKGTPFESQPVLITGMQRNRPTSIDLLPTELRPPRLVFAEQVVIPAKREDRQHMIRILAELARRSPDWDVVIKPRVEPHEKTFHHADNHISQTILETLGQTPANFQIDYRPLPELLQEARMMATVSSTALFDALDYGCKPVVMSDFESQPRSGGHVFKGSDVCRHFGSMKDLNSLEAGLPWPDARWLDWVGYFETDRHLQLVDAIERLRDQEDTARKDINLDVPGYEVNSASLSFNMLRRNAEKFIDAKDFRQAASSLELAQLLRPDHRNVRLRLKAVQARTSLARRLRLALAPKFKG